MNKVLVLGYFGYLTDQFDGQTDENVKGILQLAIGFILELIL